MGKDTKSIAIEYLMNHKKQLLERRERLARPLEEIEDEIENLEATLRSLQKPIRVELQSPQNEFPVGKIRNLTQVQALTVIAKHFGGTFKAQEAKRILIRAGVMRETKNSTNIIHAVILRSDKFERVRPGEYRLKELNSTVSNGTSVHAPIQ